MAINLAAKTTGSFGIPFEDLVEYVFDRRDEMLSYIKQLHKETDFFSGRYCVNLTEWRKVENDHDMSTYMTITGSFDVNDPLHLTLTAQEGYEQEDGDIFDTDGFLCIKVDRDSLTQAVQDILKGTILLHNRGIEITQEMCPYAVLYDN